MPTPLLLDANLTVLLVVGLTDAEYIVRHKRLAAYDKVDFQNVKDHVSRSSALIFTPNVLTEASNLVRHTPEPAKNAVAKTLASLIAQSREEYVQSATAVRHPDYVRLGLTDVTLLILARSGGELLTADLDLYLAAMKARLRATNYNHIREQRPDYR